MRIVSINEDKNIERRIAITPEIAKKYITIGFEVSIPKNYGVHLGFTDDEYKKLGVKIYDNENEIIKSADVIVQLGLPSEDKISLINSGIVIWLLCTTKSQLNVS